MATDIAFVVGCMAILGPRVPNSFRVMVLSLAIADDIGAILVIAIGYTESLNLGALLTAFGGLALVYFMSRVGVRSLLVYVLVGAGVWLAFHESGVHATIAGVLLGLLTPTGARLSENQFQAAVGRVADILRGEGWEATPNRAGKARQVQKLTREAVSPVEYLETTLHPWVSFVIMPVFALANCGREIPACRRGQSGRGRRRRRPGPSANRWASSGVSWLAVQSGMARLPSGVGWPAMLGGGLLAGIGFTMALFIAGLALNGDALDNAKIGILTASFIAAIAGMLTLMLTLKPGQAERGNIE